MNAKKKYANQILKLMMAIAGIVFILLSCSGIGNNTSKDNPLHKRFALLIDTLNQINHKKLQPQHYSRLLIIPVDTGCETCIQKSMYRSLTIKAEGEKYMVVMAATKPAVLQALVKQFGASGLSYQHVLTDTAGVLMRNGFFGGGPYLFTIDKGIMKDSVHINYFNIDEKIPQ